MVPRPFVVTDGLADAVAFCRILSVIPLFHTPCLCSFAAGAVVVVVVDCLLNEMRDELFPSPWSVSSSSSTPPDLDLIVPSVLLGMVDCFLRWSLSLRSNVKP